ncbi:MAG: hypothetical protein KGI84_03110, partial [Elusimicrobia bacterium]|nr:hypothetical protein [Elusimicrobiota bacterium]
IAELRNEYKDAGRSEQEYLDAAGALAIDIVNRICGKGDFKDKDNTVITKLRPEQEQVILTWLKDYWNGDNMAFYRLLTGGGKTLSEASIARFLVPMARMEGRKGVIITTTSEELHRQLVADLLAYGGGRVPDGIKVMTMGELMGEQAQAQAQGRPGPFQDFYLMGDEMDEAGQRPPVSVGSQTGQFSLPGINPVLLRVQTAEREAETHYRAEYKGKNVGQQAWLKMKEENPALRADVEARSRRIWQEEIQPALQEAKTPAFKERFLDPGSDYYRNLGFHFANEADYVAEFGMTPAQAYQKMMKEYKDNFGADFYPKGSPSRLFAKAGAIERLFESPEKWVERIVDGAGILSSSTEKQLARMYTTTKEMDPNYRGPNRVITVYNGEPQSKMDNYELMAAQARAGTELTLPFKHEAVVNLKGFLMAAKNAGAKVYGLSGSLNEHLADGMKKMGMKIHGEASMYPEGKDIDLDVSADGQSLKDLTQVLAAPRTSETPHLAIVGTSDRLAADRLKKDLTEAGKRALIVSHPFSVHQTNNMFMNTGIDEARAAVAKGEADVVIFVDSYRGINLVYKAFAHGDIDAYVLNPDKLSTTDFIQLIGRWAKGRLPSDAEGNPNVTVRLHGIIDGEDVPESVENLAGTPGYDSALYQWLKEEAQREMERQAVMSSGFVSTKDLKEPAAKATKAQKAAPAPAAPPSGAAVPGASSKRTLPVLKKDPNAMPSGKPKRISRKEKDQANINAIKGENRAAVVLARNGYEVEQLEETKGAANNPDYRINGRIFDCYTPQSGNVRNAADYIAKKVGKGQADRIVLNLDNSKMRLDRLGKQLKTDPIKGLKEIIVIKGNKVIHFWP